MTGKAGVIVLVCSFNVAPAACDVGGPRGLKTGVA